MGKIYIDPGHGGSDPGAVGNGLQEKDIVLDIGLQMNAYLQNNYQVQTNMSRTTDTYVSLGARTNEANAWGADLFVSIHANAGGGTGYEDYIYTTRPAGSQAAQDIFNPTIVNAMNQFGNITNRGKKAANFHVLRETTMSAILTENLFVDNATDASYLSNPSFITAVAQAHAQAAAQHLGLAPGNGDDLKGRMVRVIVDQLWVRNEPSWDDSARDHIVYRNEAFTIEREIDMGSSTNLYELKSGLYITTSPQYVELI